MWQKAKNVYHLLKAVVARQKYGSPASGMTVIGVTGTDGKTTTSSLIYHILNQQKYKTALISTVSAIINGKEYDTGFHVSTPDSMHLQSYLAKAKKAGVTHLVLEVTSHALDQNRVYGVPFSVGVLTNITREHLDYHKTMDAYTKAKVKLLKRAKVAIINHDDSSFQKVTKLLKNKRVVSYGLTTDAMVNPQNHPFKNKFFGEFNRYNTLAALAAVESIGVANAKAVAALSSFTLPKGRCEVVYDKEFMVIIDFAHTPNGIDRLLSSVAKEKNTGRIIHVFGSAGNRDSGKRKAMGASSSKYADRIILTAEDPRSESIESINSDIKQGIHDKRRVHEVKDRTDAIAEAIGQAKKGDVVVITGKGHEQSMNYGNGEEAWSEYTAVEAALNNSNAKH